MTIGIGAYGPCAGRAIYDALAAAERVGVGAIRGFVSFAAIDKQGKILRSETQRGGATTLFTEGESTGVEPPPMIAEAKFAGLISSGPDRPDPLAQFMLADNRGGLITGHRIPNAVSASGRPMNEEALNLMIKGHSAREAVDTVIASNPEADCGLIAVDCQGAACARNTERVKRRPDLGMAQRHDESTGAQVFVLHNAIRPYPALADLIANVALDTMVGDKVPKGWITINAGTPVEMGAESAVHCDKQAVATRIITTDPAIGERGDVGAAIYLNSVVYIAGENAGRTTFEPITTMMDGCITELSGKTRLRMSYC